MGSQRILSMFEEGEPRRAALRKRVMLSARLSTSTAAFEIRIRDVSATGARIEGAELPAQGSAVLLKRGTFSVYGSLVWVSGAVAGIHFDEPLDADDLMESLKGLPTPAPVAAELFRRPGLNRRSHPRLSDGTGWLDAPARR
jgi:hypothetical protein